MNFLNEENENGIYNSGPYIFNSPNCDFLNNFHQYPFQQENEILIDLEEEKDNKNSELVLNMEEANTKPTINQLLGKKRQKEKIIENENNIINNENTIKVEINKNHKKRGRKKKDDLNKGDHNKYNEDNIFRKIKSYFLNSVHELINKSFKNKNIQLLKLDSFIGEHLKKDYNLKLLDTTFKELYFDSKISLKYKKNNELYLNLNKKYINKIFEEDIEEQAIKLLNLTYRELFQIFRRKIVPLDLDLKIKINDIDVLNRHCFRDIINFLDYVEQKEIDKNETSEDINIYLDNIKNLCINYEDWFLQKKGRNRTNQTNKNEV